MRKFFNKVFYRAANTPDASLTYSSGAISGYTLLVGAVASVKGMGLEADGKDELGDGTEYVGSEKITPEIQVKNFSAANYTTIRSAFLNVLVDVVVFDDQQKSPAYAAWGVRLYPKPEVGTDMEPVITLSGPRKAGAGITNTPFTMVTMN